MIDIMTQQSLVGGMERVINFNHQTAFIVHFQSLCLGEKL